MKLYMFRKRRAAPKAGERPLPVLFLVHGVVAVGPSHLRSDRARRRRALLMETFAGDGFDVWTMDFEGYGKSSRTAGNSDIAEGVQDLKVATDLVIKETGQRRVHFFGESSGGLRAGAFAMAYSDSRRSSRAGGVHLYRRGLTDVDRSRQAARLLQDAQPAPARPRHDPQHLHARDKAGYRRLRRRRGALPTPRCRSATAYRQAPISTCTANLPVVDPLKVHAPVLLVRGEYDGIATGGRSRQLLPEAAESRSAAGSCLPGMAHSVVLGLNRDQLWHVMRSFLQMPRRHDSLRINAQPPNAHEPEARRPQRFS